jgi:hypothetical protein
MKDVLAAFSNDVFRPIITLFLPGAIALSTWVIALLQREENLRKIAAANRPETAIVLFAAVIFAGMLVEDWAGLIEAKLFDNWRDWRSKIPAGSSWRVKVKLLIDARDGEFNQDWNEYLLLAYKHEPVARRYIRALLQRMKFELYSSVALLIAFFGATFIAMPGDWTVWVHRSMFFVALYLLFFEASRTHKLIGEVRHDLIHGKIRIIGEGARPAEDVC